MRLSLCHFVLPLWRADGAGSVWAPARYTGPSLLARQLKALVIKRAHNTVRSKLTAVVQLVPPLFFTCIALILANTYVALPN